MPIVAIAGPTAVGKSAVALELAERLGGEIISVDSRCVYRYLDIGTAKPALAAQMRVPHHLVDVVNPDDEYSVARFLADASVALAAIADRARPAILVGGTGYWLRALLGGGTSAGVPPNPVLRSELELLSAMGGPAALRERLMELDPAAAAHIDGSNSRRLVRAIEVVISTGRPFAEARHEHPIASPVRVFGLTLPRDLLYLRIDARYDDMVRSGWVDEVRSLLARGYDRGLASMSSLGYRELAAHVDGELTLDEALNAAKARCRRYARSQRAWFRPDDTTIAWLDPRENAAATIERLLEVPET